ncbi:MAG: hypothetical protein AAFZ15_22200 [Bacteroidota bacterium]
MGFAEDMQNSFKYTRSLRRKKYYFRDKTFDPKWEKDKRYEMEEQKRHLLLRQKKRNQAYIEEMRANNKKGLVAGFAVAMGMVYYLVKYFI